MSSTPSGGSRRPSRSSLGATGAAVLLAILVALPAAGASGVSKLREATVSPRTGTTTTTFTFAVTYRAHNGETSAHVVVVIGGVAHPMLPGGGDVFRSGTRFSLSIRLPSGTHEIAFRGMTGASVTDEMAGGTVGVNLASGPPAEGTPKPTSKAPKPAPRPTPTSTSEAHSSGGTSGGSGGTPAGGGETAPDGSSSGGSGSSGPEVAFVGGFGGGVFGGGDLVGAAGAGTDGKAVNLPQLAVGGASTAASGASGSGDPGRGWGDLSLYLGALGIGGSGPTTVGLLPSIVGSAGAMTLVMAFMFFGKRRRDGDPPEPDEVLEAAAARGSGRAPGSELVPETIVAPGLLDAEAGMPRWRRPSLLEARKMDPLRTVGVAPPQSFQHGAVGPLDGHERRLIRYSVVSLLDTPDELHAREIGHIGRGDEVQLLERSVSYWRVLCPDGRQGWIHKMTLGEVVGGPPATNARDTWATSSVDIDDLDSDVLTAFLAARGRA